jgi:hypothetical protein
MGVKFNPFTSKLDIVDSPSGEFSDIELALGTETAPSLSFTGDPNTGIYSPGADQLAISTGGTGRLFVDSSGVVDIASQAIVNDSGSPYFSVGLTVGNDIAIRSPDSDSSKLHFLSSTNYGTGIIESNGDNAAGYLAFLTRQSGSTTERLRIDSSGRLLVGTSTSTGVATSGEAKLQIATVGDIPASFYSTADAIGPGGVIALGHARGSVTGLVLNNDVLGQIRFAGGDNTDLQTIGGQITCEVDGTPGANDMPGRLVFSTTADGASSPTERMRISSDGTAYFNNNIVSNSRLYINGSTNNQSIAASSLGTGSTTLYIGNAAIQVSSDKRIKENITDTNLDALDAISKLKVRDFTWNDPSDTSRNNRNARGKWTGLIAQELVEVLPFVVNAPRTEEDGSIDHESGDLWTLDQSQLCPVLIKAVQQQQEIITALEARLLALESN